MKLNKILLLDYCMAQSTPSTLLDLKTIQDALEDIVNASTSEQQTINPPQEERKIIQRTTMESLKLNLDILPKFNGESDKLDSFILRIDKFFKTYHDESNSVSQKSFVNDAILSKLDGNALDFALTNPQYNTWPLLKTALQNRFGEQTSLENLLSSLNHIKRNKDEATLNFLERINDLKNKIQRKIAIENRQYPEIINILTSNVEKQSVTSFLYQVEDKLVERIKNRDVQELNKLVPIITEFEEFYHNKYQDKRSTNFRNGQQTSLNKMLFNQQTPYKTFSKPNFPSQPIYMQPRFQRTNFPTNQQVFGNPQTQNVWRPKMNQNNVPTPTPMSGVSIQHNRENPPKRLMSTNIQQQPWKKFNNNFGRNHFQPTGPRNFNSEELFNSEMLQKNEDLTQHPDYEKFLEYFQNFQLEASTNHVT